MGEELGVPSPVHHAYLLVTLLYNFKRASTSPHETSGRTMITLGHGDPTVAKQESVCET